MLANLNADCLKNSRNGQMRASPFEEHLLMYDPYPTSAGVVQPAGLPVNAFPVQDLERFNEAARRVSKPDAQALWRRLSVFGGAALITAYLIYSLTSVPLLIEQIQLVRRVWRRYLQWCIGKEL
jgi:hypothetical protein